MRPALASSSMYAYLMGASDNRQRNAPRDSLVPAFAPAASDGVPTLTVNRYSRPSITGSTYASLPFFVDIMNVDASGTSTSANAGFGALHRPRPQPRDHRQLPPLVGLQVRALARHLRRDLDLRVQVPDPLLRLVPHPSPRRKRTSSASPCAPRHSLDNGPDSARASGFTGACPANVGGISIIALLISTATGFRSLACASSPRRWASQRQRPAAGKRVMERRAAAPGSNSSAARGWSALSAHVRRQLSPDLAASRL